VTRPRVRVADGSAELPIPSYELFTSTEILGKMAMEKMLAGLSTRRYPVGLEPVGRQITEKSSTTGNSAVSRKFVAMTQTALAKLLAADLSELDLVALMIDGVHFAESCCVVALGIDIEGPKHPLALVEGSTENATLVTTLLVDQGERGLNVTRCHPPDARRPRRVQGPAQGSARRARPPGDPTLPTAQGSERQRPPAAPASQQCRPEDDRCLPRGLGAGGRGRAAGPGQGVRPRTHPGAAASLREGLEETLTVLRLGVPPTLARTLRSTNAIWVLEFEGLSGVSYPARCSTRSALTLNAIDAARLSSIRIVGPAAGAQGHGRWLEENLPTQPRSAAVAPVGHNHEVNAA